MTRKHFNVLLLSILSLVIIQLVVSMQASALTYQNSVDVEFTFNPAISISLSDADLIINNLTPGSSSDSNIITVGVSTNAGYGYYMTATVGTSTGNTNLNSTTTSNVFTNLSSNAATLNDIPADRWGYSYSKDNGTTWVSGDTNNTSTGYNGLPLDNNDNGATGVALLQTDSYTNSDSIKFKIAAHASPTQATGTYTNVINFYAVANPEPTLGPESCTAGKICYHKNALTTVEGTMGEQTAASDGNTTTLLASNFSRTGYGFAGWSDTYDYSGNLYGPQEEITIPSGTTSNGLSLYAIWIKSAGSIQDATKVAQICSSLTQSGPSVTRTINSVSALTDQRDNNTYAIAKLADGNCWMIENLRLESTNSDNSAGNLAQGYGGQFAGLATAEPAWANNITTANSLYSTDGADSTINIGTSNAGYRFPRYNHDNTNSRASSPTTNGAAMYSYGNYYTWSAAIADTTAYTSNNTSVTNTSICPTGWHLPTGGLAYASGSTSGVNVTGDTNTFREFYNLGYKTMDEVKTAYEDTPNNGYAYYSSNTTNTAGKTATAAIRSFPNNFVYSGSVSSGLVNYRGSDGYYWSSTAISSNLAYNLYLHSSNVYPGTNYSNKYSGRTVRCVAPGV